MSINEVAEVVGTRIEVCQAMWLVCVHVCVCV